MKVVEVQLPLKALVFGLIEIFWHPSLGEHLGLIDEKGKSIVGP
jgi:hypothetical protein